jgi:trimethylamine--corrinoid protein Co-methyltransferase
LIDQVGPGGEYVSTKETARRFRAEIWMPTLLDRQSWAGWEADGSPAITHRITTKVREILADHKPPPLPAGTAEKIGSILEEAQARSANG